MSDQEVLNKETAVNQINAMRQSILRGEEVSKEELRRAIIALRSLRGPAASKSKAAAAPKEKIDVMALFNKPSS